MTNAELFAFVRKNPISIGCGLLSVALVAVIYFRSGDIPTDEADLILKTDEAERFTNNIKQASQLKEQLEAVTAANKEIERRMIHVSQLGTNYQYFFTLERETGTKIDVRQVLLASAPKTAVKTAFIPVAFNVTVQGDQAQLLSFLRRLESGAHYARVLSATCTGSIDRQGPLSLSLNLELLGLP